MKTLFLSLFFTLISINLTWADAIMDRINKSGKIRCGYVSYYPGSLKNPNTGIVEGYNVDIMREAGKRLGLEVEWSHETNWPIIVSDAKAGKFDALCVSYWSNPKTSRHLLGSIPLLYQPVFFMKRAGDNRFNNDFSNINKPDVRISILDGDVPETILDQLFPKAKKVALPQLADFSQVFQEVAAGRADLSIASKADMRKFEDNNPGILEFIDKPVRLYASAIQFPAEAVLLKNAIDVTLREMHMDGTIKAILGQYAKHSDDYYFVQFPFTKIDIDPLSGD